MRKKKSERALAVDQLTDYLPCLRICFARSFRVRAELEDLEQSRCHKQSEAFHNRIRYEFARDALFEDFLVVLLTPRITATRKEWPNILHCEYFHFNWPSDQGPEKDNGGDADRCF